ncbi:MAG: ribbon-helix-helix protein, CopG family [Desulfuromonadaceae bacterium]|nr:ribbon-helix-helix protein, CopG family [Desulfuromonadaceae bacterium]
MAKYKEHPKYNILSMRISDKEMAVLAEMRQQTCKSTSTLLREAMQLYAASRELFANQELAA